MKVLAVARPLLTVLVVLAATIGAWYALVTLTGVSAPEGDLTAEVGAGDLALEDIEAGRVEAEVETGGASVTRPFSGAGELYVETGDIVVDAPEEAVEDLDLH